LDPNATVATVCYNSIYRYGVDAKRRVQMPAKWRAEAGQELSLVIWRGHPAGICLRVLPPAEMQRLRQNLNNMPQGDTKKAVLKRLVGADSEQVVLDTAGRILLPDRMAQEAGLAADAVLVGLLDYFEIWNPQRFDRVRSSDELLAQEAFAMLD
jgi:MraZ protein